MHRPRQLGRDALYAIVNAALMAGENVPEPAVRKIFAQSLDFVVHLDRDLRRPRDGDRACAVRFGDPGGRPLALHRRLLEPIFFRRTLGEPWCGPDRCPPSR